MTVTQTPVAFLCIVMASALFAACHPAAPARTLDRPVRTAPATRVTLIAGTEPYAPATRPAHGEWPTRPVTIIVPFLPGGDTNMYARMFAPLLADILGQPVYVVNVDGDSGTIGAGWVSAATPDGYTVLFYHTGNLFANVLTGATELSHDDFEIACIAMRCYANVLVAHSDVGINNAGEFLERIRANPGSLSVATTITGFSFKLLRLAEIAGGFSTNAVHVGGGSMMAPSVLGRHTEMGYNNVALFLPYIAGGEMIPLWIAATERNAKLPEVPTMAEVGIPGGYTGRSYFFAFPVGTDESILRRLSDAVRRITEDPLFRQQIFEKVGMPAFFVPFDYTHAYLDEMWAGMKALATYMRQ